MSWWYTWIWLVRRLFALSVHVIVSTTTARRQGREQRTLWWSKINNNLLLIHLKAKQTRLSLMQWFFMFVRCLFQSWFYKYEKITQKNKHRLFCYARDRITFMLMSLYKISPFSNGLCEFIWLWKFEEKPRKTSPFFHLWKRIDFCYSSLFLTRVSPVTSMAESGAERTALAITKRKINHLKECKWLA